MSAAKVKTADVRSALDAMYADDAWERYQRAPGDVLLHEVQVAEGRAADAVLVRCWKSRGYELHGFEIKVSRADWLRELKDPAKAEPVAKYMDRWFVVAPTNVVKVDELPRTWGLMQFRTDGKLVVAHPAPRLSPVHVDREFMATLVRRAFTSGREEIRAAAQKARAEGFESGKRETERQNGDEAIRERLRRLEKRLAAFEDASGMKLDEWRSGRAAGEAVAWLVENRFRFPRGAVDNVRAAAQSVERFASLLEDGLAPLLQRSAESPA